MFTFTEKNLKRLCEINSFPVKTDRMIFFGLRGAVPVDYDDHEFREEHDLSLEGIDYLHPRCTLGQWIPEENTIAVFPGSTVPHKKYIARAIQNSGKGANQLMTGYYYDYRKAWHKAGKPTAHEAFRQTEGRPVRRTADDFDYDNDDRCEFMNPYDNLHAAWCMGLEHDEYASAGCQVVVGYPKCAKRGDKPDIGSWKIFKENAYGLAQKSFPYILLNGRDAQLLAMHPDKKMTKLLFGSKGNLVKKVQKALKETGFYEGIIDGKFERRTLRAVLDFQEDMFGPSGDDGIVGPMTASAMGIEKFEIA